MTIDLCFMCVAVIGDRSFPTWAYRDGTQPGVNGAVGEEFNYLSYGTAKGIQDGSIIVMGPDGFKLPMVAITTKNNSRICGIHVTGREDKVNRTGYLY